MSKVIIYPIEDGKIAILWPSPNYPVEEVAKKDVPVGLPYRIIDSSDLPQDGAFRSAWTADFSVYDGIGVGFSQWFADNVINKNNPAPPGENVNDKDRPWPKV